MSKSHHSIIRKIKQQRFN